MAYRSKGGQLCQTVGRLDMREERGEECHKLGGFLPINKQIPVRAWILTAILCSVACVTIVCATIWACSMAGIGLAGSHQHQLKGSNSAYTENLTPRRLPETSTAAQIQTQDQRELLNDINAPRNNAIPLKSIKMVEGRESDDMSGAKGRARYGQLEREEEGAAINHQLPFKRIVSDDVRAVEGNFKRMPEITQISSPDDIIGQTTTHLAHTSPLRGFQPEIVGSLIPRASSFVSEKAPTPRESQQVPDWILQSEMEHKKMIAESPPYADYGPEEYFYSELDAQAYYSDYDQGSWTGYIMEKIQDLHDWISGNVKSREGVSKGNSNSTIPQILQALNRSIVQGDASFLLLKLKDLYYGAGNRRQQEQQEQQEQEGLQGPQAKQPESGDLLTDTSAPASFGLLTLDVMLLRSLQLMAWDDRETATNEVLSDPEVFAMNALFMEPEQVKIVCQELKEERARARVDSESLSSDGSIMLPLLSRRDSLTSSFYSETETGRDLVDFAFSTIRAAVNLGRVFRLARTQIDRRSEELKQQQLYAREIASLRGADGTEPRGSRRPGGPPQAERVTELDCVWTLYCRNLDKAARKSGIYGFLAKLNSLGLRLLAGELRANRALDALAEDTLIGAKGLNCDKIFPRCSTKNAPKIVLEGIVGRIPQRPAEHN